MQFDGVVCEGVPLKVRRPKDYIGIDPSLGSFLPGTTSASDSPNKLFIGGLPTYLNDEQVLELLKSFGELRSFNLVKETQGGTQVSKVGVFIYQLTLCGVVIGVDVDRALRFASILTQRPPTWPLRDCTISSWAIEHWWFNVPPLVETLVSRQPSPVQLDTSLQVSC